MKNSKKIKKLENSNVDIEKLSSSRSNPAIVVDELQDEQIKTKAKQILVKQMDLLYQRSKGCDYCELEKFSNSLENLIIIALSL